MGTHQASSFEERSWLLDHPGALIPPDLLSIWCVCLVLFGSARCNSVPSGWSMTPVDVALAAGNEGLATVLLYDFGASPFLFKGCCCWPTAMYRKLTMKANVFLGHTSTPSSLARHHGDRRGVGGRGR